MNSDKIPPCCKGTLNPDASKCPLTRPQFGRSDEDNMAYLAELEAVLEEKRKYYKNHPEQAKKDAQTFLKQIKVI